MKMENISTKEKHDEGQLQRTMGFWPLVIFGVIAMGPGGGMAYWPILQPMSGGFAYIAYIVATLVLVLTVLSYQRMLQTFPEAGSAYIYSTRGINPKVGFLVGWILMIDYAVVPMFTLRLNAMYFTQMIPEVPEWGFILIFGLLIGGICVVGLKLGAVVELVIGISAVIVVFIFNFQAVQEMLQNGVPIFHSEAIYDPDKIIWGGVFNATAIAFMSMLGFDGMTTLAEETKMSTKKMSYAVMTAVIIQALCLLVTTYLMGAVMDWTTIPKDQFPTAYMYMLEIFTSVPFAAFLVTVNNISILACIMAFVTVSSRILFSMGRNGVIPKSFFGHLSPKLNTPVNNIVFITVIAITGALLGDFNVLGELISYGGCVGFFFVNISVISYFWVKQKDKRIFRHLVLPLLASCSIMVVLCNMGKITLTVGITWSIIGLLYLIIGYKMSKTFRDNIDSGHLEM